MANYLTGTQDYIPQYQAFQPDYNFLGNILQTKQANYDKNYQKLNQQYGQLLNSPLTREDNKIQRDEFFKMIDGDIKRISGLDLSLQQNVDAANSVFDSFLKNKNIIYDMAYTRNLNNSKQQGENYKNCIDQDKCGGKYWDTGMQELYYREQEFKNASPQDALKMKSPSFTPMINVQEKVMNYAKQLLGKDGAFGIEKVGQDKSGQWMVTMKNGQMLTIPLDQLINNQYGQDADINAMYKTQAYVKRKSWIDNNAHLFNGDTNLAENAYFQQVPVYLKQVQEDWDKAHSLLQDTTAKKDLVAEEIRKRGSTGDDDIAHAYYTSSVASAAAKKSTDIHDQRIKIANAYNTSDDIEKKRELVDQLIGIADMKKDFFNASSVVAALTPQETWKENPYAKSLFDYNLDVSKLKLQYGLMDQNELHKTMYKLAADNMSTKHKLVGTPEDNQGVRIKGYAGTSTGDLGNEKEELTSDILQQGMTRNIIAKNYTHDYLSTLTDLLQSQDPKEAYNAFGAIKTIMGEVKYSRSGQVIAPGYNSTLNKYINRKGQEFDNPQDILDDYSPVDLYQRAKLVGKSNSWSSSHKAFLDSKGQEYDERYNTAMRAEIADSKLWNQNNKNIKDYALNDRTTSQILEKNPDTKIAWDNLFNPDGSLKSAINFVKDYTNTYMNKHQYDAISPDIHSAHKEALKQMEKAHNLYTSLYNSNPVVGGKPLVQPLNPFDEFNNTGGGKTSDAIQYTYSPSMPGARGTQGLFSVLKEINNPDVIVSVGVHETPEDATKAALPEGKMILTELRSWLNNPKHKSEVGNITHANIALNNPGIEQTHITLPQEFLKEYKGTIKAPGWGANPELAKGLTIYQNNNSSNNLFSQSTQQPIYNKILDVDDVSLNIENGGTAKIYKKEADGSIRASVTLKQAQKVDGKIVWRNIEVPINPYRNNPGGQNVYDGINMILKEAAKSNMNYIANTPDIKKIYNPNELPGVLDVVKQASGEKQPESLQDAFLKQVQFLETSNGR